MEERASCKIIFEIFLLPEYWNEKYVTTEERHCEKNRERNGCGERETQKEKKNEELNQVKDEKNRSRWLRCLRRRSAAA